MQSETERWGKVIHDNGNFIWSHPRQNEDQLRTHRGVGSVPGVVAGRCTGASYPNRQIRLVVPFAAGGPADLLGRVIAADGKDLGQQVYVDNRPGGNTIIAAELVAKADPDGYTLLLAIDGTLVMNPFLYGKLSYDPFKDFAPISLFPRCLR